MTTDIIIAPPQKVDTITFTPEAIAMKEAALAASGLVGRVSNPAENESAVVVQAELQKVSRLIEKARVEVTKPLLDAQRTIKARCDAERKELESELLRVSRLIGDYQALQEQKRRAEEAAKREELAKLERERMAEIAKATSHEQVEAIQEHYNERARIESAPPPEPVRAAGQSVVHDWEITRINEHQLAKARPDLVRKIEFDMRAIKDELKRGVKLPGVDAREVVNARVRTSAVQPAIEV